mgnify:CR=1 FL=1
MGCSRLEGALVVKEKLKFVLGLIILILLGFLAFCLLSGVGVLIGFTIIIFPVWQIVLGTILGSVGVFLYLMEKSK